MAVFQDVPDGSPNQADIEAVAAAGIMVGQIQPDGSRLFHPDAPLTRREFAVIINRMNVGDKIKQYLFPQSQGENVAGGSAPASDV